MKQSSETRKSTDSITLYECATYSPRIEWCEKMPEFMEDTRIRIPRFSLAREHAHENILNVWPACLDDLGAQ